MCGIKWVTIAIIAMIVSTSAAPQPHKFGFGVPVAVEPIVPVAVPRIVPVVQPIVPIVQPIVPIVPVYGRFGYVFFS